jgi:transcriptional regulator with XRE-family HTH domain
VSTIGTRLKSLIKYSRLTQEKFADQIGTSRGYISLLVNDHEPMTMGILEKVIICYPMLNVNWILMGEGPMMRLNEVEEKIDVMEEPKPAYNRANALACLQQLLDDHEERILELEGALEKIKAILNQKNDNV